jgi:hypothetical protein
MEKSQTIFGSVIKNLRLYYSDFQKYHFARVQEEVNIKCDNVCIIKFRLSQFYKLQ